MRSIRVGCVIGTFEGVMEGETPRWADISAQAALAEEVGFDSIWLPDHMMQRLAGRLVGAWESTAVMSALAATTERIELGASVFCTLFRNPALFAKAIDTIDEISNGRVILGLGAGGARPEFPMFGYPTDHHVSRFAEAVQIITGLLRYGEIDYEGTYYQARECQLRPRGPRPNGPPILIGAGGPRMMQLAVEHADIWNWHTLFDESHPRALTEAMHEIDDICHGVGRDPASLQRSALVTIAPTQQTDTATSGLGTPISGSPEVIAETLLDYKQNGFSEVQAVLHPHSPAGINAMRPVFEALEKA